MIKKRVLSLCVIFFLIGCNQETLLGSFVPQEEVEFSKQYLTLFQKEDFDGIENKINPALKNEQLRTKLKQMAAFFPKEKPKAMKIVGSHTFTTPQFKQFNLTFQYEFPNKWLLVNIVLHKKGDEFLVNGINVRPLSNSIENINQFTLQNKPIANYLILVLAIIIPLFILLALVLCIKTPMPKRKWLWIIFILSAFVKITINWTTGGINIQPLSFLLLGAGFWKVGLYGPILISVAIPFGAIIFMIKRKKWLTSRVENQD